MKKESRLVSASGSLLAIAFAMFLNGCATAGADDAKAEKAIKALGGQIDRDDTAAGKPIIWVSFQGKTQVTDAGLKELAGLKSLRNLILGGTGMTDAGLKELAGLKSLQVLYLDYTKVTDAGLKELAGLENLKTLNLDSTGVTNAGLTELAGLKNLYQLYLSNTKVTAAGERELRNILPECRVIR